MSRRKQIKIPAKDLFVYDNLVGELEGNPLMDKYDLSTIQLVILEKKAEPKIRDVDRAIENLKRYAIINKDFIETFEGEQIINKKDLAHMMKVTRPTLDRWIQAGFIRPVWSKKLSIDSYPIDAIIEQLERQKKKNTKK